MNLNKIAHKAMVNNPCVFRKKQYDIETDDYEYNCSLTIMRAIQPHYSKTCDPTTCPIWKTYIMQLIAAGEI